MADPLDLVASMVLDTGGRWGEEATPEQWDDMEALLGGQGPRRHLWLRARGRSKTYDVGAATLAMMLAGGLRGGDELYAAAAGREQAGHLARKMRLIGDATPELAGSVDVQNFRVVTPRTGAVLDVISSDLATSWGKTPRWLFVDEFANHDTTPVAEGFIDALLSSLPKRRDSQFVGASTPSSPNHWSHRLWLSALAEPDLWRCSVVSGPAPWQDPAELEFERRRLTPAMWRRLFLCEWAELDDALATIGQVLACVGHEGPLGPDPVGSYVHGVDLSEVHDVTAVATCHAETRAGREILVLDRLRTWSPGRGKPVPLSEVEAYVTAMVGEYGGLINCDPWQARPMMQRWNAAGFQVKQAAFSPQENSRRASLLLSLIRERQLDLPAEAEDLFAEITSLRLAEGSSPGVLKLTTDGSTDSHFDRAMALMLCAQELMTRPAGSWLGAYGTVLCAECDTAYASYLDACPRCSPQPGRAQARDVPDPGAAEGIAPGGWMAAYGAKICDRGHAYVPSRRRPGCPRCAPGGRSLVPSLPRVAGIGR